MNSRWCVERNKANETNIETMTTENSYRFTDTLKAMRRKKEQKERQIVEIITPEIVRPSTTSGMVMKDRQECVCTQIHPYAWTKAKRDFDSEVPSGLTNRDEIDVLCQKWGFSSGPAWDAKFRRSKKFCGSPQCIAYFEELDERTKNSLSKNKLDFLDHETHDFLNSMPWIVVTKDGKSEEGKEDLRLFSTQLDAETYNVSAKTEGTPKAFGPLRWDQQKENFRETFGRSYPL